PVTETPEAETLEALVQEQPAFEEAVKRTPEAPAPVSSAAPVDSTPQADSAAKLLCSFCNKFMESNEKISLNIPPITCHIDCFQCATCAKPLGDLMSPMFHYRGKIHCEKCFNVVLHSM
ncbi:hypothetical protein PDJAM_G00259320, partial [Pangasius djambal]|nr:hypothetical protein [Pangasius djambal]